jgi:calmodulin-regulated spectrin-associated protein
LTLFPLVNRSPSASNIYRHYTPPKEVAQPNYLQNKNGGTVDSDFVVHKSKGITTLFNMQDPLLPAKLRQAKEKTNNDSKADERGKYQK